MRHFVAVSLFLWLASSATAAPVVTVQGRLLNLGGEGVDGSYAMTFRLFSVESGGGALWQEILPAVAVADGVFSAILGTDTPLTAAVVDQPSLWVEMVVAGELPLSRQPLSAAPLAIVADRARDVACSSCISPEETTFMPGCGDGQILRKTSGAWGCVDLVIPTYSGTDFALSGETCPAGQVMRGVKADGTANCAVDKDTTYSGANFAISGQGCGIGQVVTGIAADGTPTCAADKDTTYSGANFALSNKACGPGQVQRGVSATGEPVCITDAVNSYDGTDFALSAKLCAAGQFSTGTKADGTPNCVTEAVYGGTNFAVSSTTCPANQVMRGVLATGQPNCVADANTTYSGSDFAVSGTTCATGKVMRGVLASGQPNCIDDADTTYTGANFAQSNKTCAATEYMRGITSTGLPVCEDLNVFINTHCRIIFGWRDSCDGCSEVPSRHGRVRGTTCTNGVGTTNTCTDMTFDSQIFKVFGLNTGGDVNEDDKFYIAFKCY